MAILLLGGAGSAQALDMKVNFQPAGAPPAGYVAETGLAYSAARGYGFVAQNSKAPIDISSRTRDRNIAADERLDTLIHLDVPPPPARPVVTASTAGAAIWQADVPDGDYVVTAAAGDPSAFFNSTHRVNVEGNKLVDFTSSSSVRSKTESTTVHVADGTLTIDSVGGTNTKLQYVTIVTAPSTDTHLKFNFAPSSGPAVSGYTKDTGLGYDATRGYGWVTQASLSGTHTAADASANTRDRNLISDQRLDTLIHMQPKNGTPVAWEAAVPNGQYDVTFGVGDPSSPFDSTNVIHVEGAVALEDDITTAASRFRTQSATVSVADGRLTIDAIGGTNTKLDYVTIDRAVGSDRPTVTQISPGDGMIDVTRGRAITAGVFLTHVGAGVDERSLPGNARLEKVSDGSIVPGLPGTSGGGDIIIFQPSAILAKNTEYRFVVTNDVRDASGSRFEPKASHFTTNSLDPGTSTAAAFSKQIQAASVGKQPMSVTIGPDNRLYASTLQGYIYRYEIADDGTLSNRAEINTVRAANGGDRNIVGLTFDPASTAGNLILWITSSTGENFNAPDWNGKISKLTGNNLQNIQDFVINLPRSVTDHQTNSLAFGPDGKMYVSQGSNSAMGRGDTAWGNRPEHKLAAAILKVDLSKITSPPLDAKTDEGGTYDPWAANAPVTIYASGVRNAYDLLWDTNGELYTAVNGSAAGGNTPATPSPLPAACNNRLDMGTKGPFAGPSVPALTSVRDQEDLLLKVAQGGYYGHPNPTRCEYTFFGGNPTSGPDILETPYSTTTLPGGQVVQSGYATGTLPDRNWRPPNYVFGFHFSPNGMIQYSTGALKDRLLITRYSAGDDVVALKVDPVTHNITGTEDGIPGLTGLANPLDLIEDTRNGNIYVTELDFYHPENSRITLLKPMPVP